LRGCVGGGVIVWVRVGGVVGGGGGLKALIIAPTYSVQTVSLR